MKIKKLMKKIILFSSVAFLFITGCRKSPDFDDLSYQFLVSTSLDKQASFGSYQTFAISNAVKNLGGTGADSILTGPEADQLIQTVVANMVAKGYSQVNIIDNPDLGLTISVVKDVNVVVSGYPGWWDGYYGGCYWYYYCYGYYYPWTTVYTYTTGTIMVNMYDLEHADDNGTLNGIWNITALGALGSSPSTNLALGIEAINQGFEQSPYLKTN
jgi:hypothetical protein